jgi:hypothetical protein
MSLWWGIGQNFDDNYHQSNETVANPPGILGIRIDWDTNPD